MKLRENLDRDVSLITAWSTSPSLEIAGALAACPFDAVTVDMQHGGHDEGSAFASMRLIHARGKPGLLRIPVGRNDLASRALDMGFEAVIAPMVNSVADAQEFADAMKYPPLGNRSWGPMRALELHSQDTPESYFKSANRKTLAIAMIETREAFAALDDLLSVEGIDGVFVGPSDLSISWSGGEGVDPKRPDMQDALADIAKRTREAGKFAAIFAVDPASTPLYVRMGYRLTALNTDPGVINAGAALMLEMARG
ncbi:HpcH/HpaI aldolase/citrate lyase family protein [Hoeflea sp.]|uniref:HpcH/HpaI aldolase family protein n=1 Tax=Hoeflea sp. TaxID=1940281 RepID=UPI003748F629